jgi:ABC-type uncharacterized transport system substrate-binding protein
VTYPLPIDTCSHSKLFWLFTAFLLVSFHRAKAQQPAKIPRVVWLAGVSATAAAPRLDAFRQALRDHGYIEGQNILIETRHEGRDLDRLPEHAAELVGQKPEVFVAVTTNAALAAKAAAAGADYADGYSNERKMGSLC